MRLAALPSLAWALRPLACFPSPAHHARLAPAAAPADVPSIKAAMARAAGIHARIFDSYNLAYDPAPGSILDKAAKLWRKKQARK